jgi:TRAP-type C4-dicarboxylate transport system permease small subunit
MITRQYLERIANEFMWLAFIIIGYEWASTNNKILHIMSIILVTLICISIILGIACMCLQILLNRVRNHNKHDKYDIPL